MEPSIPAMAASSASPICLACGELAAKKDRRLLDISGRVTKKFLLERDYISRTRKDPTTD